MTCEHWTPSVPTAAYFSRSQRMKTQNRQETLVNVSDGKGVVGGRAVPPQDVWRSLYKVLWKDNRVASEPASEEREEALREKLQHSLRKDDAICQQEGKGWVLEQKEPLQEEPLTGDLGLFMRAKPISGLGTSSSVRLSLDRNPLFWKLIQRKTSHMATLPQGTSALCCQVTSE